MKSYTYKFTLEESSEQNADAKVEALSTLAKKLSVNELSKLAHVVKTDPVKTALAKKYLGV
jgi:hypothetical protein